jgi:hypothetical protein
MAAIVVRLDLMICTVQISKSADLRHDYAKRKGFWHNWLQCKSYQRALSRAAAPPYLFSSSRTASGRRSRARRLLLNFVKRMEHSLTSSYGRGYETPRDNSAIGKAPTPGHPLMEARQIALRARAQTVRLPEFNLALGTNLPTAGPERFTPQADPRPAFLSLPYGERTTGPGVTARRLRQRLPHRVVDAGANCQGDRAAISCPLSSTRGMVPPAHDGVELPETRPPGAATRRSGHCPVAAVHLAPYKKRLRGSGRSWFSWTKVGFCLSLISSARGRLKARPQSVPCATKKAESMRLVPWPYRPSANAWPSTSSFGRATLTAWRLSAFSTTCCAIYMAPSSCCGIAAPFIGASWSKTSCSGLPASTSSTSRPTRLNLIPLSMGGIAPMTPWPTVLHKPPRTFTPGSVLLCASSSRHSRFCGLASTLPIYPGHDEACSFTFTKLSSLHLTGCEQKVSYFLCDSVRDCEMCHMTLALEEHDSRIW